MAAIKTSQVHNYVLSEAEFMSFLDHELYATYPHALLQVKWKFWPLNILFFVPRVQDFDYGPVQALIETFRCPLCGVSSFFSVLNQ
jgi:hypothetical protein